MELLRQYNVAATILFPLITRDAQDFKVGGITFAAADTQISKNEAAFANTNSVPVHEGNGIFSLALTATEMTAARISITCVDAATKLWEDQAILIQTFGDSSAAIQAQWQELQTPADIKLILGDIDAAFGLFDAMGVVVPGTVDDTAFTPTATQFEADDITEATADHYKDRIVIFKTGVLADQAKDITAYSLSGGRGHFTVSALTEAPGNNDTFIIV